jgi:hypothetical protein
MNDAQFKTLLEAIRGERTLDPRYNYGTNNSGVPTTVFAGPGPLPLAPVQILSIDCKTARSSSRRRGCATVSIDVKDASTRAIVTSNQKMDLTVKYNTGRAIGIVTIDAARGTKFCVSAEDSIQVFAQIVAGDINAVTGAPNALVPGQDLAVTAACSWGDATTPSPVFSSPRIALASGVASIVMPIPAGARELWVLTDQTANLVTISFTASTAQIYQAEQGRNAVTSQAFTPVAGGADGFTLNATKNSVAQPLWILTQLG